MSRFLNQPATRRSEVWAGAVVLVVLAATLALLPQAKRPCPVIIPFLPMFVTTVIIVEGLTAYFLAVRFRAVGATFLGMLSGAYGFVAVIATVQILVFPGVFSTTGLFGAGPQTAVWIWVFWHGGFAALALAALLTHPAATWSRPIQPNAGLGLAFMALAPLLALCLASFATRHGDLLPVIIQGGSYGNLVHSWPGRIVLVLNGLALLACIQVTKLGDKLSLGLAVAIFASCADCALTLSAGGRYSLGWYGGRILSVVSSSVVLCVMILEFSKLYQKLEAANRILYERALRDGLTGAFNRSYFDEHLQREVKRATREATPLALIMIDVDHFKDYNDIHGHPAGDKCLIAIVGAIRGTIRRPGDFVARYGGEEFAVVLPTTNLAGALELAQLIRQAVRDLRLTRRDAGRAMVTISLGLAVLTPPTDCPNADALTRRADQALYEAKHAGRDTARVFGTKYAAA